MVTEGVSTAIVAGLAGNPAMLLLAIVLVGIGFLGYKFIGAFQMHSASLADNVKRMADDFEKVREDIHDLKRDIAVIAERVGTHEVRISQLERKVD